MKITIDKNFTTLAQRDKVKEDIKEFKSRYSDSDIEWVLKRAHEETYGADLLAYDIEAFPHGQFWGDETSFAIHAWLTRWSAVFEVWAYVDIDLTLHEGVGQIYEYKRA